MNVVVLKNISAALIKDDKALEVLEEKKWNSSCIKMSNFWNTTIECKPDENRFKISNIILSISCGNQAFYLMLSLLEHKTYYFMIYISEYI